ncbi:EAL domain-containing protein [Thermicanus aegyptius]|uniref:EAL domain-containing protein n=1 Tax=Thermicanus aegyptius TaxID=94009 RepID=UPI00040EAFDD|nr:EAL domain-containing protein [Thermicanus aegyptius]
MKWYQGIAFRFALAMNLLVLVTMILLSGQYLFTESKKLEDTLREEGVAIAGTLGSAIGKSMLSGEYSSIGPLAYALISHPSVQYVIIRDPTGRVVNQKGETVTDRPLLVEQVPLLYFQKKVGEIEIALKTDRLQQQKEALLFSTLGVALVVTGASILLSIYVSRKLTSPLKKLMEAVHRMGQGERNIRVKVEGTWEIQDLSKAFNQMAEKIGHHEENLEEGIKKATATLRETIGMLELMGEISRMVMERDSLSKEVIGQLLSRLAEFFKPDWISLAFLDRKDGARAELYLLRDQGNLSVERIRVAESPMVEAVRQRKPLMRILSKEKESEYPRERIFGEEGLDTFIILPLIAKDQVIGTLNVACKAGNRCDQEMMEKLSAFAHTLAIVLDRAHAYESLRCSAFLDFLTGLPNYRALKEDLEGLLRVYASREDQETKLALLFLDLDRFKTINDTLGHDVGDLLLQKVATTLQDALSGEGKVYRMGGDEFILLLPEIGEMQTIREKVEAILAPFRRPWFLEGYELPVSASVGISLFPGDGKIAEELIKHADTAMYRVKLQGKSGYAFYTPSPDDPSFERIILENDLHKGLEQGEFEVYYQPKVEAESGKMTGVEALLRWHHPKRGLVDPGEFIPLAEETGLILHLGEFVLRRVCEQGAQWLKQGYPPITISVNLSTRQFMHSHLVSHIQQLLKETGFPPSLLELEITETVTLDVERAVETLSQLKKVGVQISIDDFGTGYSSLHYLQHLPIDRLKIDRSFVENLSGNESHKAIVATIIAMAKNLALKVTAEGVEKEEQVRFLKESHCDELQGFYFSIPLTAGELEQRFLKK